MKDKTLDFNTLKFLRKIHNCDKYFIGDDICFGYYDEGLYFIEFFNFLTFLRISIWSFDFVIQQYFLYDTYRIFDYNINYLTKTLKKL